MAESYIGGFTDTVLQQLGTKKTLQMLLHHMGGRIHKKELFKDAEKFLLKVKEIADDHEVTFEEIEDIIDQFEQTGDMDVVTALLGTFQYQYKPERRFKNIKKGDISQKELSIVLANVLRYFFMRFAEMADELDLLDSQFFAGPWRLKRAVGDLFAKEVSKKETDLGKIKRKEAGEKSECKTLKFFMSELIRGRIIGGLSKKSCRQHIIKLCNSFNTTDECKDIVMSFGDMKFQAIIRDKVKGTKTESFEEFDFTRFIHGLASFIRHKDELEPIRRHLQVLIAQFCLAIIMRFSYYSFKTGLYKDSPNRFDQRDIRKALRRFYGLTDDELMGKKDLPVVEKTAKTAGTKKKTE